MDLEQKYKEETGFSVGKIHGIGIMYYSDDYVKWLEAKINFTDSSLELNEKTGYNNIEDIDPNWTSYTEDMKT